MGSNPNESLPYGTNSASNFIKYGNRLTYGFKIIHTQGFDPLNLHIIYVAELGAHPFFFNIMEDII